MQPLESLQTREAPASQVPAAQVSEVVQALPSSQATVLLAKTQPEAGSQESVVQVLASLQERAAPALQVPALHLSLVVQALPSSQATVLLV